MAEEKKEIKEEKKAEEKPVEGKAEAGKKEEAPAKEEPKKEAKPPAEKKEMPKGPNIVHAALFLHSAGKDVNEDNLKKVVKAVGVSVDDAQVKSLVANLEGVDIDEAVSQAVAAPAAAPVAVSGEGKKEGKKEEQPEKKAEEAAAGLSSLFG